MYKTANGWTKAKMIEHIKANFKGRAVCELPNKMGVTVPTCMYLTPDGKKCAIGLFVPDGHRLQTYGNPVQASRALHMFPDLIEWMPLANSAGLNELQGVHDQYVTGSNLSVLASMIEWIEYNVMDVA